MTFIKLISAAAAILLAIGTCRAEPDGDRFYRSLLQVKEAEAAMPLLSLWFEARLRPLDDRDAAKTREEAMRFAGKDGVALTAAKMFVSTKDEFRQQIVDSMQFVDRQQAERDKEVFPAFVRDWKVKVKAFEKADDVRCKVDAETIERDSDGKVTEGRFVFYVPSLYAKDGGKIKSFNRVSSPTEKAILMAGEYRMWSQRDQAKPKQAPPDAAVKEIAGDAEKPVQVLDPK